MFSVEQLGKIRRLLRCLTKTLHASRLVWKNEPLTEEDQKYFVGPEFNLWTNFLLLLAAIFASVCSGQLVRLIDTLVSGDVRNLLIALLKFNFGSALSVVINDQFLPVIKALYLSDVFSLLIVVATAT